MENYSKYVTAFAAAISGGIALLLVSVTDQDSLRLLTAAGLVIAISMLGASVSVAVVVHLLGETKSRLSIDYNSQTYTAMRNIRFAALMFAIGIVLGGMALFNADVPLQLLTIIASTILGAGYGSFLVGGLTLWSLGSGVDQ